MARTNYILKALEEKGEVRYTPHGNSMTPMLISGEEIRLKQVPLKALRTGDAVYVKVKGSYYCHLLTAIDENNNRYQISNNHNFVNGWVSGDKVYALCVEANGKVLVSNEEIARRLAE